MTNNIHGNHSLSVRDDAPKKKLMRLLGEMHNAGAFHSYMSIREYSKSLTVAING